MGVYIYGITEEEQHPDLGAVGRLKFLYKPHPLTDEGYKRNNRLYDKYAAPLLKAYENRKLPKYVKFGDDIYRYRGDSALWSDARWDLLESVQGFSN